VLLPGVAADGPIDQTRLKLALNSANLPTLLTVLVHLTGEERWLEPPFRPSRPRGLDPNDSGDFSDELAAEIRAAAYEAIVSWGDGRSPRLANPEPAQLERMLTISMGESVPDEYARLMREELGLTGRSGVETPVDGEGLSVIVVGAGVSGLLAGARLKRLGIPFQILERNDDVGGVWLTNGYPGAGVDTPSYLYSFADLPRNWTTHFAKRDEVLEYLAASADELQLRDHIIFGLSVDTMRYDAASQKWAVSGTQADGSRATYSGHVVIRAIGLFNRPKSPSFPGEEKFRGALFHTAEWPDTLELRDKRVAVVGTGASAMQVVPAIVDDVASLTIFQNSPQWVAPADNYFAPVGDDVHWLMSHIPYYHAWYRFRLAWTFNDRVHGALKIDLDWPDPEHSLNAANDGHRKVLTRHIVEQLEGRDDLKQKALPDYPPFGKRMLLDNGWFAALKRPNVELLTGGVAEITEGGIVTADGREVPVDVVVLATGFHACDYLSGIDIIGRDGRHLSDEWEADDARAYLGMTVPGYPNLFLMYGPNTNSGAGGSYIFIAECQIRYIAALLTTMSVRQLGAIECRPEVCERWIELVDREHESMIWTHPGMSTYYRNARGRVVVNMPWRIVDYWTMTHDPDLGCFTTEPARSLTQ
jgi:4-hydroxyacetophenone monooxygenase